MRQIVFALLVVLLLASFTLCARDVNFSSGPNGRPGGAAVLSEDVDVEFFDTEQEEAQLQASEPQSTTATSTATTAATVQQVPAAAEANSTTTATQQAPVQVKTNNRRRRGFGKKSGFGKHIYTTRGGASTQRFRFRRSIRSIGGSVRSSFRSAASHSRRFVSRRSEPVRSYVRRAASRVRSSSRRVRSITKRARSGFRRAARKTRKTIRTVGKRIKKRLAKKINKALEKASKDFNKTFGNKTPQQLDEEIQSKGSAPIGDGNCITSCQWFTLPNYVWTNYGPDKSQICGACAKKYIIYTGPCYSFPEAFQTGQITAEVAQSIKERCKAEGHCSCASIKIDNSNVKKIRVKSGIKKVFAAIGKAFKKVGKALKKAGKAVGKAVKKIGKSLKRIFRF